MVDPLLVAAIVFMPRLIHHLVLVHGTRSEGRILKRDEIAGCTANKLNNYYFLNGHQIGDVGNDGPDRFDYATALAKKPDADPKHFKPVSSADFDQNYEPIGPNYPGTTPGNYTVRSGDTLIGIALAVWGDSSLWYLIADANGLSTGQPLVVGMNLVIPNKVTNIHNNSQTYRVYDPGKAIGDTSPTLPDPPPPQNDDGCGTIGMIIIIIVIIVTIYTAGVLGAAAGASASAGGSAAAAGTAAGTFTTGAAVLGGTATGIGFGTTVAIAATAGAVGSIVGQGLSIAAGYQDEFSWRQVGIAAIGAGVTAGLGAAFGGAQSGGFATKFSLATKGTNTAAAINAAVNSVATPGVLLATGLQEKFDWKSVAASAVTAAVSNQIGKSLNTTAGVDDSGNSIQKLSNFAANHPNAADFTTRLISGVTGAYIRHGITNNRIDFANVAADSVGSFLADEIVGELSAPLETSKSIANTDPYVDPISGERIRMGKRSDATPEDNVRYDQMIDAFEAFQNSGHSGSAGSPTLAFNENVSTKRDVYELGQEVVIGKREPTLADEIESKRQSDAAFYQGIKAGEVSDWSRAKPD